MSADSILKSVDNFLNDIFKSDIKKENNQSLTDIQKLLNDKFDGKWRNL